VSLLKHSVSTWFISHFVSHFLPDISSGLHIGGKIAAILFARVGGMTTERVKLAARMLPDTAPLIPVKAQRPKHLCQHRFPCRGHVEPNPLADNLGSCMAWK
jgi:hypothetical protein